MLSNPKSENSSLDISYIIEPPELAKSMRMFPNMVLPSNERFSFNYSPSAKLNERKVGFCFFNYVLDTNSCINFQGNDRR